jgi:hypothetical protein
MQVVDSPTGSRSSQCEPTTLDSNYGTMMTTTNDHYKLLRKELTLKRLRTMKAAGKSSVPRGGTVKLRVSIRLAFSADFVDLYIITNKEDYMDSLGVRSKSIWCSLLIQIGNVFGLKIPNGCSFMYASEHWRLTRTALAGKWESKEVGRLKDIANGNQLMLCCDEYLSHASERKDSLKGLPFKNVVKVSLISPLVDLDVNAGSVAYKVPIGRSGAGGKENMNDYAANNGLSNMSLKSAGILRNIAPDIIGKNNNNEPIIIGSDDESDYSSDVEDITAKWRASRDEERRRMMANAEVID